MCSDLMGQMWLRVGARVCEPRSRGTARAHSAGTMKSLLSMALLPSLLIAGCSASSSTDDPEGGADDPGQEQPADDYTDPAPATDDGYVPKAMTATRFGVFYQIS